MNTAQPTHFRERGKEMHRVEALSDAIFAFAVSLLAVALEVPQDFEALEHIFLGALPFFAAVSLLFLLWYQQHVFFRHYALRDFTTIVLNLAYLAVILFYLYPLKFLFQLLLGSALHINYFPEAHEKGIAVIQQHQFPYLIMVFSAGYAVLWLFLYAMHRRALHHTHSPELSAWEKAFTQKEMRGALGNAAIGVAAILLAWANFPAAAGVMYLLIPLVLWMNNRYFSVQTRTRPHRKT